MKSSKNKDTLSQMVDRRFTERRKGYKAWRNFRVGVAVAFGALVAATTGGLYWVSTIAEDTAINTQTNGYISDRSDYITCLRGNESRRQTKLSITDALEIALETSGVNQTQRSIVIKTVDDKITLRNKKLNRVCVKPKTPPGVDERPIEVNESAPARRP